MSKNRMALRAWTARIVIAGGVLAMLVGVPLYMSATTTALHPDPQGAPSVIHSEPSPQWSEAVGRARHIVRAGLAQQNLPGASVSVSVGGDIVWAEGFGWADIKNRTPVTPDTQFRIGTASKVLTSAAVGVLLEKGRLNLDEEIRTHVPQFPKKQWAMTLRQLMGHVAGVGTESGHKGPLFAQRCERPVDALQHFANGELLFEPGTRYLYSNYGWILVSAAVEAAADQPFLAFMREQIFQPLRMAGTGAESATEENPEHVGEPSEDAPFLTFFRDVVLEPLGVGASNPKSPGRATLYSPRSGPEARKGVRLMRPHNLSCYAGSMAFFSTASDLVRFGQAMNGGKLLQPATVHLLQSSQQLTSRQETGYGLGWDREAVVLGGARTQAVGHDGELWGGRVMSLMTFPERGIVVAVMSNISYADTSALALQVAEAFAEHSAQRRSR